MKKILSAILSAAVVFSSVFSTAWAEEGVPDIAYELKWNEKTITEQFACCKINDSDYVTNGKSIDETFIGEKTGDVKLLGYDIYDDIVYYADAETYALKTISYDCAAAVKIQGNPEYYVYKNYDYFPDTLGGLIDALDLENTISFGDMYLNDYEKTQDYDKELVISVLLENKSCKFEKDLVNNKEKISFSTDIELLGIKNKSLSITKDGYLKTNIMEQGYSFYIGKEASEAFADSLGIKFENYYVPSITQPAVTVPAEVPEAPSLTEMTTEGYVPEVTTVKMTVKPDSAADTAKPATESSGAYIPPSLTTVTSKGYVPDDVTVSAAVNTKAEPDAETVKQLNGIYEQLKQFEDENSHLSYNEGVSDKVIFISQDIITVNKVKQYIKDNGIDENLVTASKPAMSLGIEDPYEFVKSYIDNKGYRNCTIFRKENGKIEVSCSYEEDFKEIMNYIYSYSALIGKFDVLLLEGAAEVFIKGDVSGDGKVSIADAVLMQSYLTKKTDTISKAADLNNDSKVNVFDYVSLSHIILK